MNFKLNKHLPARDDGACKCRPCSDFFLKIKFVVEILLFLKLLLLHRDLILCSYSERIYFDYIQYLHIEVQKSRLCY
jgi:hypothetical protein